MENLHIYEQVMEVPNEAKKPIQGGKLKGKTDINPMWRIRELTRLFGPCGIGWVAPIKERWIEEGASGERAAFVEIALKVKVNGEWSEPITGIGGSMLIALERGALTTNDEAYKMAYTDAISVACKALGFGAKVYWAEDKTKYTGNEEAPQKPKETPPAQKPKETPPPQTPPPKALTITPTPEEAEALGMIYDGKPLQHYYKRDKAVIEIIRNDPNAPEAFRKALQIIDGFIARSKKEA
jgi:hypothetical protein